MFDKLAKLLKVLPAAGLACTLSCAHAANLPDAVTDAPLAAQSKTETVILAAGCFWGVQGVFQHVKGVTRATSGYAGGKADTAFYDIVSSGTTGHAESVEVVYDASKITLGKLLKVYFSVAHDPTQLNRQGADVGTQYRSQIFFTSDEQKKIALDYIAQLDKAAVFDKPIVTRVEPLEKFYAAEGYHQNYVEAHPENPYVASHDIPKIKALFDRFPDLYVD